MPKGSPGWLRLTPPEPASCALHTEEQAAAPLTETLCIPAHPLGGKKKEEKENIAAKST